jgi:ATP-dependent helicase/nuclease subunit A
VLVLVRKRDRFVHALTRALKRRDIPVAAPTGPACPAISREGPDCARAFLIQPQDDLSLAAVLRSPIFDLSEETLSHLPERPAGLSLIASLNSMPTKVPLASRSSPGSRVGPTRRLQAGVRILCRRSRPRRTAQEDDRAAGTGAGDILDEFLTFCLAEERTGLPGLDPSCRRWKIPAPTSSAMDQTRDEVRVMTVHAARAWRRQWCSWSMAVRRRSATSICPD